MAGPIAVLAVRLSAQLAEFQTSFKDATKTVDAFKTDFEQFASKISGTIDGVSKAFTGFGANLATVGVAVAGVAAAGGAAILAFKGIEAAVSTVAGVLQSSLKATADLGDQFFTLSQQTGLSVEAISGFKFAAAQTGTSLEAITGAVFKLEANLGKGGKATADAITGIGLSIKTLKAEAPEKAFQDIIEKLANIPNASQRAAAGVEIFGKSFKDISVLAAEGKGGLKALTDQAESLGIVMSTRTAVAADRFHDGLGTIAAAADGLTQQLGAKLLPAAVAFTEVFGKIFIDAAKGIVTATKGTGEGFDAFVIQLGEAMARGIEVLAKFTDGVAKWAEENLKTVSRFAKDLATIEGPIIAVARALDQALAGGEFSLPLEAAAAQVTALKGLGDFSAGIVSAGPKIREFATGVAAAARAAGEDFGATFKRIQAEIAEAAANMKDKLKGIPPPPDAAGVEAFKAFEKQLATLTTEIDRAVSKGAPLSELVRLFGDEALKASDKAHVWGITVKQSVEQVAAAFAALAQHKEILSIIEDVDAVDRKLKAFQTKDMQAEMQELAKVSKQSIDAIANRLDTFGSDIERQWRAIDQVIGTFPGFGMGLSGIGFTSGQIASFAIFGQKAGKDFSNAFQKAASNFAQNLPQALQTAVTALQGKDTIGAISGFGAALGASFVQTFSDASKRAADGGDAITVGERLAGNIGTGLVSFSQGAQFAQQMGKFSGAITAAIAGGLQGFALGGPVGAGVGVAAGLAGAAIGPNALEQEQRGVRGSQIDLRTQLGGAARIQEIAARMPQFEEAVRRAFTTVEVDKFNAAVADINVALEEYNAKLKGLTSAQDGLNKRTATFTAQFADLAAQRTALLAGRPPELLRGDEAAKFADLSKSIAQVATRTQPEFERLGVIVQSTFGAIVKQTGDGFAAIQSLAPSFQALKSGISDFGLTSTAVIDLLVGQFDLINSEITGPFIQNVQSSGQVLRGLFDAKSLNADSFQALAADIGQNLQEVANRGGDMAQAFALSQPVLQTLFEAQQQFGAITDDTTAGILAQAEAQGIVGNQFKSTQEKTLEVLLSIAHVFNADIPAGIETTATAATAAGATIGTAFSSGVDAAGASVGGFADKIRTQVPPAAADAAAAMRRNLEIAAFEAGVTVTGSMSNAAILSAINLQKGIITGLNAGAKGSQLAADDIAATFGRIKVPPIEIPVHFDVDKTTWNDFTPDDVRISVDTSGIPKFGSGAIVQKRTLAFVGESGPEAIVPLSGSGGMQPDGMRVIFEQDGRAAAEFLVPYIPGVVQRYRLA